jgi:hypothetical protein
MWVVVHVEYNPEMSVFSGVYSTCHVSSTTRCRLMWVVLLDVD